MVLRMAFAPEVLTPSALLDGKTVLARRLYLLPRRNRLGPAYEDGARRVTNEARPYRAEDEALDNTVIVRSNDHDVRGNVAGQLRNLQIRTAGPNVQHHAPDRRGRPSDDLFELRLHLIREMNEMKRIAAK